MINEIGDYRQILLTVLRDHTDAAVSALHSIDRHLPEKTRSMQVIVHLPQDADGTFSVMAHLAGPDLFVLNKAIDNFRSLFDVRILEGAVSADVPLFDPHDQPFSVNDAIVDIVMVWLREVWAMFGGMRMRLPVTMEGEEGFVSTPKVSLAV